MVSLRGRVHAMKKNRCVLAALLVAVVLCSTAGRTCAQEGVDRDVPGVEVTSITGNFYLIVCSTNFTSNCVAMVSDVGILLVDSGLEQTAGLLVEELNKLSDKPVKFIVHTHGHQDHTGANAVLGENATIIAQQNFERNYKTGYGLLLDLPREAYPDKTFVDEYSFEFGGERIRMLHMAGGHGPDDAVVQFTNAGIVCTGGLYSTGNFPYLDLHAGGDVKALARTIYRLINAFPDDTIYVPSHGAAGTKEDLRQFHDMLLKTMTIIQGGLNAGMDIAKMQAEDILAGWESWAGGFVSKNSWIRTVATCLNGGAETDKKLILEPLYYTLQKKDAAAAISQYHALKKSNPDDYDFGEANLNALGYYLLGKERYDDAIEILELNVTLFPESANPYDSLGEAYMRKGDKESAVINYEKALAINPGMPSAIEALRRLKGE